MDKIDMSPSAVTMRIEKLSQLRELCLVLKQAGKKAGLHSDKEPKNVESSTQKNSCF
ncbi:MAG: hypothetical protein IPO06_19775 [Leptospiraceae bacterium]|nr:hypothetical protein [Leptospiraceae bacterium]MBK7058287.1 hypothetical protein [Leptospiraceae bacterium]MBK9501572.1 hypothetical protein [Leptospiraceae bacterium]